ncbi:MAG TPA: outer membrane beta-barrel protein [Bacteroidales bacterium]|nr:outer membrane beta-barrel protein [Bacteroidales bacterium]
MKKIFVLLFALITTFNSIAQAVVTGKSAKVSVGFDLFTDIATKTPDNMKNRTINQGFNAFLSYNFKIGEGPHVFAIGAGLRTHNFYSNTRIVNAKTDTIVFRPIDSKLSYSRSKFNINYIDIPAEFRFRFDDKWKVGIGFKLGMLLDSKEKYIGQLVERGPTMHVKTKKINSLEKYSFGPTLRVGYKAINVFAFFQPSPVFGDGLGPEFKPVSVGITITPF